ncbi:MAG: hypothetical protein PHH57_05085 [Candidatus Omnitrophica bacterium]|nr:hypothetical protein [Candidatus Omnitrophota bacterium]
MLLSACQAQEIKPEPYQYTHSTELKQLELYEYEHIKNTQRTSVMTLAGLGYPDVVLVGEGKSDISSVEYQLPEDATQGPDTWYIINLHFLIEFTDETSNGFASVSASPGASVQFETLRVNDSPLIRVRDQSSTSTRIDVRYFNYLTYSGVKPGKNVMHFKFREDQGTRIKSIKIFSDTGLESTTVPPSKSDEQLKLTQEEQAKAKEIAFNDSRVQELAEGKEYAVRITRADALVRVASEPPDDDIEVRLVFADTYMIEDVPASALDIFVDLNEGAITYLFPLGKSGMPELTASAREKALNIALADARVQQELVGKSYTTGKVGLTMGGPVGRLGANVPFTFEKPYPLEPKASTAPERQQTGVKAVVNLREEKVVDVLPVTGPLVSEPQLLPPGGQK